MREIGKHPENSERQNAIAEDLARHMYGVISIDEIAQVETLLKQAYTEGYFEAYIDQRIKP